MRMASVTRNSAFLPGKLNRAKAYPPSTETASVKATVAGHQGVAQVLAHPRLVVGERHVVAEAPAVGLRRAALRRDRGHRRPEQREQEKIPSPPVRT